MSDPITEELFRNAISAIGDEMVLTIYRTAYSGVLKNIMDYSAAICDAQGRLVAQGLSLPGHLCSIPVALPNSDPKAPTAYIALGDLGEVKLESGASYIYRENSQRFVPLKYSVRERDLGSTVAEAQKRVADKVRSSLHDLDRGWLAASPFCFIATAVIS